jgi:hypothetical protein
MRRWIVGVHPMISLSDRYRFKALASERSAKDATDPALKLAWAEIAIEWHALANRVSQMSNDGENSELD